MLIEIRIYAIIYYLPTIVLFDYIKTYCMYNFWIQRIVPILGTVVPDLENTSLVYVAYMAIAEVAAVYPGEVEKYSKQLLDAWEKNPMTVASACKTIANIGRMNEVRYYTRVYCRALCVGHLTQ